MWSGRLHGRKEAQGPRWATREITDVAFRPSLPPQRSIEDGDEARGGRNFCSARRDHLLAAKDAPSRAACKIRAKIPRICKVSMALRWQSNSSRIAGP